MSDRTIASLAGRPCMYLRLTQRVQKGGDGGGGSFTSHTLRSARWKPMAHEIRHLANQSYTKQLAIEPSVTINLKH